ncbi:glutamine--tRNA ligase, partial [bacterium]|nr:glutamine--tRNA ligase [bacterium]
NYIEMSQLENCVRESLDQKAPRAMAVLDPLRVVIENYPEGQVEEMEAPVHPQKPDMGTRKIPFSKVVYIERDDFMEDPPKKFFRLGPGREVRLRYAYIIKCDEVIKDEKTGDVKELRCSYYPDTKSGSGTSTLKVKGVIHWVSEDHSINAEVRLYDRLFQIAQPTADKDSDFISHLNYKSVEILKNCRLEPGLKDLEVESVFQFERLGYFNVDPVDSTTDNPVFNRTVTLRDSWAKMEQANQ